MTRRKERHLRELYGVTGKIMEPEITPVLRGCCGIQGPKDETDREGQKNTGLYRGEIRSAGHSLRGKVCMGTESGTCNVCSAPCSSCMHLNRAVSHMELKAEDEYSDETSRVKAASRCSFNVSDMPPISKDRAWGERRGAASEASNLVSVSSSHDSFSENAESKVTVRTFDTSDASEDVEMVPRVLLAQSPSKPESATISSSYAVSDVGNRTFSDRFEEQRGLECHGDNISCVSGTNDANMPYADLSVYVGRKNISSSSASVSSFSRRRFGKEVNRNSVPDCAVDMKCEVEEKCGNFRKPSVTTEEIKQEGDPTIGCAPVGCLTNAGIKEVSSKDLFAGNSSLEVRSPRSRSKSRKSPFADSDTKDSEDNTCSHHQPALDLSNEHGESSCVKLEQCHSVGLERPTTHNSDEILPKLDNSKPSLISTSGASRKLYPCIEAGVSKDSDYSKDGSVKCLDLNEQVQKPDKFPEVPSAPEPSLQSQSVDESDDSEDIVEDVKVCDICGDAGREDLLAICSKCGDGAEHTYCMRIKMEKVPEGYWLCEECKFKEEAENEKQDKFDIVAGASKVPPVKKLNSESALSPKRVPKISDVETNRAPKVGSSSQFSSKRQLDNHEGIQAAKRQAVEASSGSPRPCSPSKKAVLSRESSFKNLDKGKVKPVHQAHSSGGIVAYNSRDNSNSPTTSSPTSLRYQPRPLSRGILSKSKSFNSFSKPKVKTMQEDFRKKPKSSRDTAKTETKKEGFRKSQSFRSARPSSTLSKDIVRSTHFSGNEELRALKQAKDRNGIERMNSFKSDRSLVRSPKPGGPSGFTQKTDHKAPRGDLKSVQPDGKLSKPASLLANRGLDIPKPLAGFGDPKRQSFLSRGIASPLSRMTSSTEKLPSQVSPKDESTTSTIRTSERPGNRDAVLQDSSRQSQEPVSHSRQSISAGDSCIRCQKCKEIGHEVQSCPLGISRASVIEPSAVGCTREVMSRSNKPRGAVETSTSKSAVQKSIRLPDQSDESDLSCDVAKYNPSPSSSCLMGLTSAESTRDGLEGFKSSADSSKLKTMFGVKQNTIQPIEASCSSRAGAMDTHILSNGNFRPSMRDSLSIGSTAISPFCSVSIPEYEYRWQGGFRVQRSGRSMDIYDGIQAHLSTCASPKVHEAVITFPYHVVLEEVPRLSTWPSQFQNYATEDNIALYFFAKDFESYEKSYRSLLENLIKNDLALKGNLNGVELLIFPSNQLPEKSQRWNMLYFLWGVFRVRRLNCTEHGSQAKPCGADLNALPTPTLAVSQKECSHGNVKESSTCSTSLDEKEKIKSTYSRPLDEQEAIRSTMSMDLPTSSSSSGRVGSKSCGEIVSLEPDAVCLQSSASPLGSVLGTNSLSSTSTIHPLPHGEMKGNHTSKDALTDLGSNKVELEPQYAVTMKNSGLSNNGSKVQVNLDKVNCLESVLPSNASDCKDRLYGSFKGVLPASSPSLGQEAGVFDRVLGDSIQERSSGNAVILLEAIKDEEVITGKKPSLEGDVVTKEYGNVVSNSCRKRSSSEAITSSSQSVAWEGKLDYVTVDDEKGSKRMKSCYSEMCGSSRTTGKDQNPSGGRFPTLMYNLNSPPIEEPRLDKASPENSKTAERHFFPMDLDPVKDWRVGGNSVPLHVLSSDDEDQPESMVPNLELALGAERRSTKQQGMLPLFAALDKKTDQGKLPDNTVKEERHDEDALASLSLSLAFSLPEKERSSESVPKPESLLPGRPPVDTKLFLYGGFSDT